jgi:hypothetical protein
MKIIHELRKKINSLEKELKAANDHISFLTTLTGGALGKMNDSTHQQKLFGSGKEVPLDEKLPPSIPKGDSSLEPHDEIFTKAAAESKLELRQQKSTPQDGGEGVLKSEIEILPKTAGGSRPNKQKKSKGDKGLNNSKYFHKICSQQHHCKVRPRYHQRKTH